MGIVKAHLMPANQEKLTLCRRLNLPHFLRNLYWYALLIAIFYKFDNDRKTIFVLKLPTKVKSYHSTVQVSLVIRGGCIFWAF